MTKRKPFTALLWGSTYFDEFAMAIFLREFRQAQSPFKVIGLCQKPAYSRRGVSVTTNLSLDMVQPFINEIQCLIFPYNSFGNDCLTTHSQLGQFFRQVATTQALFVLPHLPQAHFQAFGLNAVPIAQRLIYPPHPKALTHFARSLIRLCTNSQNGTGS